MSLLRIHFTHAYKYFRTPYDAELECPMRSLVYRFMSDKSGATAIEYALIAGGISIVIIGTVTTIGSQLNSAFYDKINSALK